MIDPTGPWCWLNTLSETPQEKRRREDNQVKREIACGCSCLGLIGFVFLFAAGLIGLGYVIGVIYK